MRPLPKAVMGSAGS
jgi:maltose alpha-D-glucosyltransferase / alpha-amylase